MTANKVYDSIVKLLFNVVRDDELKYHLYKDKTYLTKFVNLVNNLLKLEIDEQATYNDEQWAKTFGKAIVIISQQKQRIQKSDKNIDEIYVDYSEFISFTNNEYQKTNLDNTTINFTHTDVLNDAKLPDSKITFYEEKQNEKEAEKIREQEAVEATAATKEAEANKNASFGNNNQNQNQSFNGNPFFGNGAQINFPVHPQADPRFYPYNKKPKWFPIVKMVLGIAVVLACIISAIVPILLMTNAIDLQKDLSMGLESWEVSSSVVNNDNWKVMGDIPLKLTIIQSSINSVWNIYSLVMWFGIGAFLAYALLKKPRNMKEKYRISLWILVPILILFGSNLVIYFNLLNLDGAKNSWKGFFDQVLGHKMTTEQEKDFNSWWAEILTLKHADIIQTLAIFGITFTGVIVVTIVGIMIAQPKLDREKMMRANLEYQNALAAAMQGRDYQMDESLFDNDEVVVNKKSKFKIWMDKTFKKKKKDDKEQRD